MAEELVVITDLDQGNDVAPRKCCSCLPSARRTRPTPPPTVPLFTVLGTLPKKYRAYMVFGTIASLMLGAVFPAFSIVFGQLFNIFVTQTPQQIRSSASIIAAIFVALGLYNLIAAYFAHMLWGLVSEAVGTTFRRNFVFSLLRQDASFFECETTTGALLQTLNADVESLQQSLGTKVANFLMYVSQVLIGLVIAFIYSWKLTLVLLAISPLMALAGVIQSKLLERGAAQQTEAYKEATSLAVEMIGGYRVVHSFVWEQRAQNAYNEKLQRTKASRYKAVNLNAVGVGFSLFCVFAVYSLGFWYGAQLVADTPANGGILLGDMLIVFFSVIMAAMGFGQAMGVLPDFARARVAAHNIFKVIRREPLIDADAPADPSVENHTLIGSIAFDKVRFSFPSRPDQLVLKDISFHVHHGSTVGIVGASGAGKSTIISLLERFHNVSGGSIRIDDLDIEKFNVKWLRRNIGLVSQEPKLFDGTIEDNIRIGKPDATLEEMQGAARAANAHGFISELADGYATRVGEGGSQLSGGQKQRIAIARAVLKNPRILLLDEATSALDNQSEAVVQEALDHLMRGRTTIVIAHRLSTIRNCSVILVMKEGEIVETGTHDELMALRGLYRTLAIHQMSAEELNREEMLMNL